MSVIKHYSVFIQYSPVHPLSRAEIHPTGPAAQGL